MNFFLVKIFVNFFKLLNISLSKYRHFPKSCKISFLNADSERTEKSVLVALLSRMIINNLFCATAKIQVRKVWFTVILNIKKQIPKSISKRISKLSSNEEIFNNSKRHTVTLWRCAFQEKPVQSVIPETPSAPHANESSSLERYWKKTYQIYFPATYLKLLTTSILPLGQLQSAARWATTSTAW